MTGDCSIFNPVLLPYTDIQDNFIWYFFTFLFWKFFFHQISKEKSAAYYVWARTIVRQIQYKGYNYETWYIYTSGRGELNAPIKLGHDL